MFLKAYVIHCKTKLFKIINFNKLMIRIVTVSTYAYVAVYDSLLLIFGFLCNLLWNHFEHVFMATQNRFLIKQSFSHNNRLVIYRMLQNMFLKWNQKITKNYGGNIPFFVMIWEQITVEILHDSHICHFHV